MSFSELELTKYKKSVIALSISSLMTISFSAMSIEDEKLEEVERIEVTGSRIKRTDMEGAVPVTIITAEDIQASGVVDIAGLLRQSTFAGNGSTINVSNNSWGNHSSTGLRGLGSERTLALVNGRRIAPSSSAEGHAVNLNMIPLEAIERVEILRDGASAIYGADAMGGVQNFILKKDYEGLAIKLSKGDSSRGGMGNVNSSILFGMVSDKGQITVAYEHMYDEGLKGGERPHLDYRNYGVADDPWRRLSSWGPYGSYHTVDDNGDATSEWQPGKDCPEDMIVDYPWGAQGQKCGFASQLGKNYYPKRQKDSAFTNLTYNFSNDLSFYAQSIILRDRSTTAANAIWVDGNLPAGHVYNPTTGTENESEVYFTSRLTGAAERKFSYETTMTDFNSGFDLTTEAGDLNVNVSYSREKGSYKFNYDVYASKFQDVLAEGLYDPFTPGGGENATKDVLDRFRHTGTRDMVSSSKGYAISWAGLTSIELPGGELGYAIGGEYRSFAISDMMDAQSAAGADGFGDLIAAWGGDVEGSRNYKAVFVEVDLPVTDDLNMLFATRYDKWSLPDAGQASSSLSLRYEATDDVVLRASYGQGFRVAGISDMQSTDSVGYEYVEDCPSCESISVPVVTKSNSNLKPETSEQISFGAVWNIIDGTSFSIDFWDIQINDEISRISADQVVELENLGLLGQYDNSRIYVTRDPMEKDTVSGQNKIVSVGTGVLNMDGISTNGIDVFFEHNSDFEELGNIRFTIDASYINSYEYKPDPLSEYVEEIGLWDRPKLRLNTAISYNYNDFNARVSLRHIGENHLETGITMAAKKSRIANGEEIEIDRRVASMTETDMNFNYTTDGYGRVDLGIYNVFDRLPVVEDWTSGHNGGLHNIAGRTYRLTYSMQF
ncbi:TonB-dependent receptor [Pseudoalteromonas denitrificans]|uniref:Iron complex outermembrane recepter protein n=1 Tax=Pseudoalteromonas denitrificans DSM 6059 TaxID=1123010 RepID=A0A1I1PP79_9GAMM|nr:TonB-dependent receptor [Pseudoalteromonas denitrificans]SFD11641.1 iron complex outermembrane recepter protein [Pseudoalteromonas denitrificans DSM 6059]